MVLLYISANSNRFNVFLIYLISFYLIVLIGAALCIKFDVYTWYVNPFNLSIFTLIYLFSANQFKKVKIRTEELVQRTVRLDAFFYFYVSIAIAYIIIALPTFVANISSGDYFELYYEVRESDNESFGSVYEKYLYILSKKFQYPALIVGFIYLCKNNVNKGALLLSVTVVSSFAYSICVVSRTDLFQILVSFSLIYFLCRKLLSCKIKKLMKRIIVPIGGIVILVFIIVISASRSMFESDFSWILEYCGRSILTFNSILEYPVSSRVGLNFLGTMDTFSINHPSYTGKEFVPLLSRMYIDFGIVGLLVFLLIPICVPKRPRKVADYYLIIYIFFAVFIGILYSTINLIQLIQTFFVYIMLRFIFKI